MEISTRMVELLYPHMENEIKLFKKIVVNLKHSSTFNLGALRKFRNALSNSDHLNFSIVVSILFYLFQLKIFNRLLSVYRFIF